MEIQTSNETNPTYENFEARCPICNYWNIYNRVTDLESTSLITGRAVKCQNKKCKKEFWINHDLINPSWQMLLLDCEDLKQKKHYSNIILNICQSFEMYFAFYLRVTLVLKPFANEKSCDYEHVNCLLKLLYKKTKSWSYSWLRNSMMNMIVKNAQYLNLKDAKKEIMNLDSLKPEPPEDNTIKEIENHKLSEILLELKGNSINTLRNKVVHKQGYLPTLGEVEKEMENSNILGRLDRCLGVLSDDYRIYETNL